jgi:hypothetical protein
MHLTFGYDGEKERKRNCGKHSYLLNKGPLRKQRTRDALQGCVVGTSLGFYPMAYFGISSVEPSGSASRVYLKHTFIAPIQKK